MILVTKGGWRMTCGWGGGGSNSGYNRGLEDELTCGWRGGGEGWEGDEEKKRAWLKGLGGRGGRGRKG